MEGEPLGSMRILVQGIGSIGQRHYKNARTLGHDVAILRTSNEMRPFVKDFFNTQKSEGNDPVVFTDLADAMHEFKPEALIIATPNHMHMEAAIEGAKQGLHLLIEKPVHNKIEGLDELESLVAEKHLTTLVGYNLRFHPLLKRVKSMVDSKEIGEITSVSMEVGENIVDWHPWEDYRDTYAPFIKSGGGALLCFSHDIDYLYWIVGIPDTLCAAGGKVTPLEGDAEDLVQAIWKYTAGPTVLLHIDYWQRPKVRTLKIIGSKKTILWDAYEALTIWDHEKGEKTIEEVPEGFERNNMFLEELTHFVECIEKGKESEIPLSQGREVVKIVENMKALLV
jgi:predicted dehydrogenase